MPSGFNESTAKMVVVSPTSPERSETKQKGEDTKYSINCFYQVLAWHMILCTSSMSCLIDLFSHQMSKLLEPSFLSPSTSIFTNSSIWWHIHLLPLPLLGPLLHIALFGFPCGRKRSACRLVTDRCAGIQEGVEKGESKKAELKHRCTHTYGLYIAYSPEVPCSPLLARKYMPMLSGLDSLVDEYFFFLPLPGLVLCS
ncbi:hypothetical protein F5Y06DRAFT_214006 [Hypoxylon sp. FL0890]|nr:hypothetical protein F5Y06DRAFT_214006 [Hypoxylon sp. FL0890]